MLIYLLLPKRENANHVNKFVPTNVRLSPTSNAIDMKQCNWYEAVLLHINCIGCWLIYLLIKTYKSFFFLLAGRLMHQCFLFIPFISTLLSLFMAQAPNIEGCWILSLSSFLVCNTNKWYLLSKNFFNEFMVLRSFLVSTSSDIVLAIPISASPHLDQYMFLMLNQISIQSS